MWKVVVLEQRQSGKAKFSFASGGHCVYASLSVYPLRLLYVCLSVCLSVRPHLSRAQYYVTCNYVTVVY